MCVCVGVCGGWDEYTGTKSFNEHLQYMHAINNN